MRAFLCGVLAPITFAELVHHPLAGVRGGRADADVGFQQPRRASMSENDVPQTHVVRSIELKGLHSRYPSLDVAERAADRLNGQAKELGILTRYEAAEA